MWFVIVLESGVHKVHSFHKSESVARVWADCLKYDDKEVIVVFMDEEVLDAFVTFAEERQ